MVQVASRHSEFEHNLAQSYQTIVKRLDDPQLSSLAPTHTLKQGIAYLLEHNATLQALITDCEQKQRRLNTDIFQIAEIRSARDEAQSKHQTLHQAQSIHDDVSQLLADERSANRTLRDKLEKAANDKQKAIHAATSKLRLELYSEKEIALEALRGQKEKKKEDDIVSRVKTDTENALSSETKALLTGLKEHTKQEVLLKSNELSADLKEHANQTALSKSNQVSIDLKKYADEAALSKSVEATQKVRVELEEHTNKTVLSKTSEHANDLRAELEEKTSKATISAFSEAVRLEFQDGVAKKVAAAEKAASAKTAGEWESKLQEAVALVRAKPPKQTTPNEKMCQADLNQLSIPSRPRATGSPHTPAGQAGLMPAGNTSGASEGSDKKRKKIDSATSQRNPSTPVPLVEIRIKEFAKILTYFTYVPGTD